MHTKVTTLVYGEISFAAVFVKAGGGGGVWLTVLHFGTELALLGVLKQRLMALHFVSSLAAGLIEQSPVPTGCRAIGKTSRGDIRCRHTKVAYGLGDDN